ncbi:Aspartate/glutamate/uridylate kinase [Spinellus fusiger]|nr:Aspartate/glutamate/uridylate kinase [Spinellus fusiger]
MSTVVIKLGGAAVTNKKGVCELTGETEFNSLLISIRDAYKTLQASGHRMVLIHGAGSFGHPQAKQHGIKEGWKQTTQREMEQQKEGFAHLRRDLLQLHLTLITRLQALGVPILGLSPFDYITTENGPDSPSRCFHPFIHRVHELLTLGWVPLLHGDAVLDRVLGCTVLSGDVIMYHLSQRLAQVDRCVFITDVHGVYNEDPKTAPTHAQLIPIICASSKPPTSHASYTSAASLHDVTGGMGGKVQWAHRIVAQDSTSDRPLEAVICKASTQEAAMAMTLRPLVDCENNLLVDLKMTLFIHNNNY